MRRKATGDFDYQDDLPYFWDDDVNVILAAHELVASLDKARDRPRDSDANRDPVAARKMYVRRMTRAQRHQLLLCMFENPNEGL